MKDNNISRISYVNDKVSKIHNDFTIGFAAHPKEEDYKDIISITAIGAGAKIIEKHLTLGKIMKIEDYESALNPDEFHDFVNKVKSSYLAYGGDNNPDSLSDAEENYRNFARKDIVASKEIKKTLL